MDAVGPGAQLSASEIAIGFVAGTLPERGWPQVAVHPSEVLGAVLRPALEHGPCVIGFSGGRDSSLLLALAVREARRHGLPEPVPVTLEFDSEQTREREWQEIVLATLGVADWVRLSQGSDLDLVGPIAVDGLRRHGVLYPGNAHMVVPLASVARGGSVVTGFGGDDVLGGWPFQSIAAVLARRRPPDSDDLKALARWAAPARLRVERYAHGRRWVWLPWLRSPHDLRAARRIAADVAGSPRTWSSRMRWLARRRMWDLSRLAMDLYARDHEARTFAPLLEPAFLAALGAAGGRLGIGDRTAVMRLLAGGLLPDVVITRETKAEFSDAYFGLHTKQFAAAWDGRSGIDPDVVDADALRATWLSDQPHGLSAALLQSAWLAVHGPEVASPVAAAGGGGDGDH
ncbi:MAG TPA: asparagine synthase-related protein [Solirubrobacteraceae bacterium]|nr:asparagine synthase-related protein [Solirubrobacteraceae bacterium]